MLVLNSTDTFTGGVRVQDGMLSVTNSAALPATSVYLNGNNDARLNLNGNSVLLSYLQGGNNNGGWVYLGSGGQLTLGTGGDYQAFNGLIFGGTAGQVTLTKTGDGMQDMGGSNQFAYPGNTLVAGGILRLTTCTNALPFTTNVTVNPGVPWTLWNVERHDQRLVRRRQRDMGDRRRNPDGWL